MVMESMENTDTSKCVEVVAVGAEGNSSSSMGRGGGGGGEGSYGVTAVWSAAQPPQAEVGREAGGLKPLQGTLGAEAGTKGVVNKCISSSSSNPQSLLAI